MCCSNAKWKREVVQDHKFDFVDVHEYRVTGFFTRLRYSFVYIFLIKSVLVYLSDIYTAVAMLANNYWAGNILSESDNSSTIKVPFTIGKWIFLACIIVSFLLLAWESRKARMIIRSRDISYAFTNIMANDYYSLKSYDHFCFFSQINNSKKKKDEFAFFVFFTFKGWKRLLLADAPRQVINALTLYSFGKAFNFTTDLSKYYNNEDGTFSFIRAGILCTMIFTVVIWAGSAILLTVAAFMYIPLLCYVQGNLKEYCCHKIDKRIAELMKRKTKKRLAREAEFAKREAAGDYRHLQDKKGRFKDGQAPLPQPTLPTIDLNDDELCGEAKSEIGSMKNRANSQKSAGGFAYGYPPPPSMPDLKYAGGASGYNDPYGQYPRYQLSDGAAQDSSYSLASHGQAYPYPSQTSLNMQNNNDSFVSFNDDKMSIRSRDPLVATRSVRTAHGADTSQVSLSDAPSYHTHADEDVYGYAGTGANPANPTNAYGVYEHRRASPPNREYEPDPQHPYADPPYVLDDLDFAEDPHVQPPHPQRYPYGNGQIHDSASSQYPPYVQQYRTASPEQEQQYQHQSSRSRDLELASHQDLQQRYHQQQVQDGNPNARGVSVAGRSEISTMYFMDGRDRTSMADSHMGAFDLDDYARQSVIPPSLRGSTVWGGPQSNGGQGNHQSAYALQRRGSNLDYLQEENEENLDEESKRRHNRPTTQQTQLDWRR